MSAHQFYWTATRATFCQFLRLKFRYKLDPNSDPEPEAPFIVVSNHGNFFDPWMIGLHFKKALHIMMNDDGFRGGGITGWYLKRIGAYAKKKGSSDIKAMKKTLSFLRANEPVLIFPEGQTTWDGETQPVYGGLERLIKRAKVPLCIIRFRGNFLSRPWWAKGKRKGRITLTRRVIPKEEIAFMTPAEILQTIQQGIYMSDVEDERNKAIRFKGSKLAEGLERLVWICPNCHTSDSLSTANNEVSCDQCGASYAIDPFGGVHSSTPDTRAPQHIHAWVAEHKAAVLEWIANGKDSEILATQRDVALQRENEQDQFVTESQGTLSISNREITYTSESNKTLAIPINELDNYVIQQKDIFEITHQGTNLRFDLSGKSPMKWLMFTRYLCGFDAIEKIGVI